MSTLPESLSGCKSCQDLWRRLTDPTFTDAVNLGSTTHALSTPCAAHRPLVESFVVHIRTGNTGMSPRPDSDDLGIRAGQEGNSLQMVESISNLGLYWGLLLARPQGRPDHPGTARVLDPDWADLDMLKRWKNDCFSSHGAKCENPMKVPPVRPAWLIDVEEKCLVPGSATEAPFVALSYVYGEHIAPGISANALAGLQQAQALELPENSRYVVPIIKHAMGLTSIIGERYLWVDMLCVPHSDTVTTTEQLMLMGVIFANAAVTIIAADGDVQEGLRGLRDISAPRKLRQRVIPFSEEEKLVVRNTNIFSLSGGFSPVPYYNRAWTYQEHMMSPRKLYFHGNELHWECSCSVWHEELVHGAEVDKYINPRLPVMLAGFPDLGSLNGVISFYNKKQLRYDEDALPAISGLLTVLSRSFPGGFLYGIPEMMFERGLGWKPMWSHTNLRRRTSSERPAEYSQSSSTSLSGLPSWSWVGWQGLTTMGHGEAARINHRQIAIEETVPITKWYTSHSPNSDMSQRREIRSTWYADREKHKDFRRPLPPGWTRHDASRTGDSDEEEQPFLHPDGCAEHVFRHEAMPEADPDEGWYYPFPVPEVGPSMMMTAGTLPEQTPYLFCETTRAWLWGRRAGDYHVVKLFGNSSGEEEAAGELYLHNESYLPAFPKAVGGGDGGEKGGLRVELVAIYKSRVYAKTWNEEKQTYGLPITRSERYTVLWVEWKEGVAYRLASGYVQAEAWDRLEREQVSLALG